MGSPTHDLLRDDVRHVRPSPLVGSVDERDEQDASYIVTGHSRYTYNKYNIINLYDDVGTSSRVRNSSDDGSVERANGRTAVTSG